MMYLIYTCILVKLLRQMYSSEAVKAGTTDFTFTLVLILLVSQGHTLNCLTGIANFSPFIRIMVSILITWFYNCIKRNFSWN